jgi:hypothetical protein
VDYSGQEFVVVSAGAIQAKPVAEPAAKVELRKLSQESRRREPAVLHLGFADLFLLCCHGRA